MQGKDAPNTYLTNDGQPSSEGLRVTLCDRQAQPGAMNLSSDGLRATIKRFKNLQQLRASDTNTVVRNANLDFISTVCILIHPGGKPDPTFSIAVLDRIDNQVLQALGQSGHVADYAGQTCGYLLLHRESGFLQQFACIPERGFNQVPSLEWARTTIARAFRGHGKAQNLVHQLHELIRLLRDDRPLLHKCGATVE